MFLLMRTRRLPLQAQIPVHPLPLLPHQVPLPPLVPLHRLHHLRALPRLLLLLPLPRRPAQVVPLLQACPLLKKMNCVFAPLSVTQSRHK